VAADFSGGLELVCEGDAIDAQGLARQHDALNGMGFLEFLLARLFDGMHFVGKLKVHWRCLEGRLGPGEAASAKASR